MSDVVRQLWGQYLKPAEIEQPQAIPPQFKHVGLPSAFTMTIASDNCNVINMLVAAYTRHAAVVYEKRHYTVISVIYDSSLNVRFTLQEIESR